MSSKYLDFQQIKEDNSIESVAARLNLDTKEKNGQLRCECPVCESDSPRALAITPSKGKFYCFAGQTGGDCIALVQHVLGISAREAAEWIVGATVPEESKKKERPKPSSEDGFQPLDYLQPEHDAVDAIGFGPTFAETVGIGFAPRGLMRGLVAVPIRDEQGTLLGYIGITEAKLPDTFKAQ